MFHQDIYSIHGENAQLVASVCDNDRRIMDKYAVERESYADAMDRREFRDMRRMMSSNVGVRL